MENLVNESAFVKTLHERINFYFKSKNMSIKCNGRMASKIVLGTSWWLLSYIAIYLFASDNLSFLVMYLFHAVGHIYFSFNVGHDALHNAISKKKSVNRFWAYSYDLLGVNTYMWRYMHHQGHHACLNVKGQDMSLETAGIMRLSNHEKWSPGFKYQHIYSFFVYGFYLFYYVFVKDFKYFFSRNNVHLRDLKPPVKEWMILFIGKGIYISYMLVLPLCLLPFPWYFILFTFCMALFMIGLVMSFTFQTTHIVEETHYPESNREYFNYVLHVFETTADYSTTNPVSNWFFGGLNAHVIHHLRADICHIHYPQLTLIVKKTASDFGIVYRENNTVYSAIKSHLKQLKKLGNPY